MTHPLLSKIRASFARDRELPLRERLAKGARYATAITLAPLRLRACDHVGARARAIGRPRVRNHGRITIGDDFVCNSTFVPVDLEASATGSIELGDRVAINYGTSIFSAASVRVGNGVSMGPHCVIWDAERQAGDGEQSPALGAAPIDIGDGAWLAGRVTLLPGARIGAGTVVTAGSVVAGELPPGVVAGGIPARVLRRLDGSPDESESEAPVVHPVGGDSPAAVQPQPTPASAPTMRGVVFADFTTGDLHVRLRDARELPVLEVVEAPFGQVMQSLMRPAPEGGSDFAIVWTRPELVSAAFQRVLGHGAATDDELRADVDAFCDVLLRAAPQYRAVLVPSWTLATNHRGLGMLDARPGGLAWSLTVMNQRLMQRLAESKQVFVLNAQRWVEAAGRGESADRAWYLGKVAYRGEVLGEAVRDIKAALRGLTGGARKLLVLDLDDTLWGGIVGDVGWENLRLGGHDSVGEALVDFQRAVKQLTQRGVVLGVASKNTESVALEAMTQHPEMVLRPDDFVGMRINWGDKARNIAELVAELNLGLQSVVFIDDNPVERARVREALPEVFVPEWPEDKLLYPHALRSLTCFDTAHVSREDAERTTLYAAEKRRDALKQEVGSLDEWLLSLGIRVRAEPLGAANLARTTQLLNKTNQMNLSTRRLTEAELTDWVKHPQRALWAVSVSDRFGDAGLTGILSVEEAEGVCRIVDFVLSCRVMGRRVEESMASIAVRWAQARGLAEVRALYEPTKKNKPCLDFWQSSRFTADADGRCFSWRTAKPYEPPACITLDVVG